MIVVWGTGGYILTAAAIAGWYHLPLNPGRLQVRRAESGPPVLTARLVPSPRELPGRPSAAVSASRVYLITDAREGKR